MGKTSKAVFMTTVVLLTLFLPGAAPPADAAVRVITPEKLRSWFTGDGFEMTYGWISSDDSTKAYFWAPVRLPVGARITRMTYYHWGDGSGATSASLRRAKIEVGSDLLFHLSSSLNVPTSSPPEEITTTTPDHVDSDMIVRRGYRYYVDVTSEGEGQKIGGVKIFFLRAPGP